jgi:hypothetical protein
VELDLLHVCAMVSGRSVKVHRWEVRGKSMEVREILKDNRYLFARKPGILPVGVRGVVELGDELRGFGIRTS